MRCASGRIRPMPILSRAWTGSTRVKPELGVLTNLHVDLDYQHTLQSVCGKGRAPGL
jgi:hypothetical protein